MNGNGVVIIFLTSKRLIMRNDSYDRAKEKARKERLKKRIERNNTPWKDKIEQSSIMTTLKSMKELADEIEQLIGKKQ